MYYNRHTHSYTRTFAVHSQWSALCASASWNDKMPLCSPPALADQARKQSITLCLLRLAATGTAATDTAGYPASLLSQADRPPLPHALPSERHLHLNMNVSTHSPTECSICMQTYCRCHVPTITTNSHCVHLCSLNIWKQKHTVTCKPSLHLRNDTWLQVMP